MDVDRVLRPACPVDVPIYFANAVCTSSNSLPASSDITSRPDFICMSELSDSSELQTHSQAVMYILSAVVPPPGLVNSIVTSFVDAIKSATVMMSAICLPYFKTYQHIWQSWRTRLNALPALVVFFYRNLISISDAGVIMDVVINCLSDDNVEVREMASKVLSGVVRVSQRQSIIRLKVRHTSANMDWYVWYNRL